jgi:hypothetical protein
VCEVIVASDRNQLTNATEWRALKRTGLHRVSSSGEPACRSCSQRATRSNMGKVPDLDGFGPRRGW